jgi:hypothetical protein
MYRLNVAAEQIEECVRKGMFALSFRPQIEVGEILLLQLKKSDWKLQGEKGGRIQYALVFEHVEHDFEGKISKEHWPNAGKIWSWIIYSSASLDVKPFSLEDLPLTRESHYQAQANPVRIDPEDEAIIIPYINWSSITPLNNLIKPTEEVPYAKSENAIIVEKISTEYALIEIKKSYPWAHIEVMNHNNPGFDILVTEQGRVIRYIEVKGTQVDKPIFHLTETEREFSKNNSSLYSLLVVWMIDINSKIYKITKHDGEVSVGNILKPYTYLGQLSI